MRPFALFMLLFIILTILFSLVLKEFTPAQILIESTILAYILQQYLTKETE
jgi:hypothetical protein